STPEGLAETISSPERAALSRNLPLWSVRGGGGGGQLGGGDGEPLGRVGGAQQPQRPAAGLGREFGFGGERPDEDDGPRPGEASEGVVDMGPELPGEVVAGLGLGVEDDAGAQGLAPALVGDGDDVDGGQERVLLEDP